MLEKTWTNPVSGFIIFLFKLHQKTVYLIILQDKYATLNLRNILQCYFLYSIIPIYFNDLFDRKCYILVKCSIVLGGGKSLYIKKRVYDSTALLILTCSEALLSECNVSVPCYLCPFFFLSRCCLSSTLLLSVPGGF